MASFGKAVKPIEAPSAMAVLSALRTLPFLTTFSEVTPTALLRTQSIPSSLRSVTEVLMKRASMRTWGGLMSRASIMSSTLARFSRVFFTMRT